MRAGEALFTRALKVRLPMQALELKIRRQHGVSIAGYRYVKALMGESPLERFVDGQEIVLRPLALCRKPGASPDEVSNAFIIEPRDANIGPHLLYQPLYADALHEYPTRQALLDALASPGALQDSVLTWLSDKARPIYDHGGIREPHLIRFLPGDELSVLENPSPLPWRSMRARVNGCNHRSTGNCSTTCSAARRERWWTWRTASQCPTVKAAGPL